MKSGRTQRKLSQCKSGCLCSAACDDALRTPRGRTRFLSVKLIALAARDPSGLQLAKLHSGSIFWTEHESMTLMSDANCWRVPKEMARASEGLLDDLKRNENLDHDSSTSP
ncbi:hypothetical protein NDU88_002218 [Pleurodeles waltl]|uniref:Uncharacterized protein n=1 Tax=Pleurodeles waltl TaxID=8319 RepID=A0AAV7RBB9_PLEWA|nr:hypothetical protein NDU88_002218 [Pleurodeles waltl]